MEGESFESKIPEDILEMLYDLGGELNIDPISSIESEDYFSNLILNYKGEKDELEPYLKKHIENDFKCLKEQPEWLQGDEWQFSNGKPMCFVGQMEVEVNQEGYIHTVMFYVFWDIDSGDTKTITQSD